MNMLFVILDEMCYLKNRKYELGRLTLCSKANSPQECQLTCQLTPGCSMFSYYTSKYVSAASTDERNARDCCVNYAAQSSPTLSVREQGVISGPRRCPNKYLQPVKEEEKKNESM